MKKLFFTSPSSSSFDGYLNSIITEEILEPRVAIILGRENKINDDVYTAI